MCSLVTSAARHLLEYLAAYLVSRGRRPQWVIEKADDRCGRLVGRRAATQVVRNAVAAAGLDCARRPLLRQFEGCAYGSRPGPRLRPGARLAELLPCEPCHIIILKIYCSSRNTFSDQVSVGASHRPRVQRGNNHSQAFEAMDLTRETYCGHQSTYPLHPGRLRPGHRFAGYCQPDSLRRQRYRRSSKLHGGRNHQASRGSSCNPIRNCSCCQGARHV